jgi:triosephosphate isomerase
MRVPFIAGNWKMNTSLPEACDLVRQMQPRLDAISRVDKVICPPFISLASVAELFKGSSIILGAQNLYFEDKGAFTGEISPIMLSGLCLYVILGHSERRHIFGESNEIINKKVKAAMKTGLSPILCVGERLEENESGQTQAVIASQLNLSLSGISDAAGLVVAYEPVWAIGTGRAASGEQANRTIGFIRHVLAQIFDKQSAQLVRILYGGSVIVSNISEFVNQPEVDGALVGGASLKADDFTSIVSKTAEIKACL